MNTQIVERQVVSEVAPAQEAAASSPSLLPRIFNRHLGDSAFLVLVAMTLSTFRPAKVLADPDIWWHLANGRIMGQTHHFIRVEQFSFTVAGLRWIDPEWLSELGYWTGYRALGLRGVYVVAALAFAANILFLYWRGLRRARHPGSLLWVSGLGLLLMSVNANGRTSLFGYLCMSAELAILQEFEAGNKRILWLLPPIFCVWINLHGSWLIGIGLLVLYLLCGAFRANVGLLNQQRFSSPDLRRLLAVLGLSIPFLFVNPYGWGLVWNPFDMMINQKLNIANVNDWQPLDLSSTAGQIALVAVGLSVLLHAIRPRKWKVYEVAFVLFAWYAAFEHWRFLAMAAVIVTPILAGDVTRQLYRTPPEPSKPQVSALLVTLTVVVFAILFPSEGKLAQNLSTTYPLQSIASIQPGWRTLNDDRLGGIMDFYGKRTMIDTRWDIFEHKGVMADFLSAIQVQDSLTLLDKYQIDHVLMSRNAALTYLLEHTPGWSVIRREGTGDDEYELIGRTGK